MKKLLFNIVLLISLNSFSQSLVYDSSHLFPDGKLYDFYHDNRKQAIQFFRGQYVPSSTTGSSELFLKRDLDYNVSIGVNNTWSGTNNFIGLNNGTIRGNENFGWCRNIQIIGDTVRDLNDKPDTSGGRPVRFYPGNGITALGADMTFYSSRAGSVDYSTGVGDAHNFYSYAGFAAGFSNTIYSDHGVSLGQNNLLGSLSKFSNGDWRNIRAQANKYLGGGQLGDNNRSAANWCYQVGLGLINTEPGVYLGIGSSTLGALMNHVVLINGVKYLFEGTPTAGSVLACTGVNGDVYNVMWTTPAVTQKESISLAAITQAFAIYNTTGQFLGNQVLILKPITKQQ